MKYMVMMHTPRGGAYEIYSWPKADIEAHMAYFLALNKKLSEAGELVAVQALAEPGGAKIVRAGKDGAPITDGVFPEAKEFLAGFWMIDVDSPERACAIAAEASAAPGPGGAPLYMAIELRQVMSGPPPDLL